jgi:hypothetical protein
MMIRYIAFVLATASAGLPGAHAQNNAQAQIDAIVQSINGGDIGAVEMFGVPPDAAFRANITPERLEGWWAYKLTVRGLSLEPEKLRMPLSSAAIQPSNAKLNSLDVRTAIVFYAKTPEGKRIASLYFDRSGRHGAVNNVPVAFPPDLLRLLKKAVYASID